MAGWLIGVIVVLGLLVLACCFCCFRQSIRECFRGCCGREKSLQRVDPERVIVGGEPTTYVPMKD